MSVRQDGMIASLVKHVRIRLAHIVADVVSAVALDILYKEPLSNV